MQDITKTEEDHKNNIPVWVLQQYFEKYLNNLSLILAQVNNLTGFNIGIKNKTKIC